MINDNYEILDDAKNGNKIIKLTTEPYSGIMYHYGRVKLIEEEDILRIQFEHDVVYNINDVDVDNNEFKNYIGEILVDLLEDGLLRNELVYTGGTDEN